MLVEIFVRFLACRELTVSQFRDFARDAVYEIDLVIGMSDHPDVRDRLGLVLLGEALGLLLRVEQLRVIHAESSAPHYTVFPGLARDSSAGIDPERIVRMIEICRAPLEIHEIGHAVDRLLEVGRRKSGYVFALLIPDVIAVEEGVRLDRERDVDALADFVSNTLEDLARDVNRIRRICFTKFKFCVRIIVLEGLNFPLVRAYVCKLVAEREGDELVAASLVEFEELLEQRKRRMRVFDPVVEG